ncbi:MAG: NAD(+) kinase [Pseudomonadales bacterium]|nr:NAD(+) kinase [Pseudomonadales bacterium]
MLPFCTVGLVARTGSELVLESLRRVRELLARRNIDVCLEDRALELLGESGESFSQEQMGSKCDLVIAVGGDGNILGAARTFAPYGVPILGVNRGRLGFLADVSPDEIETSITQVLNGNYTTEEHFLLEGEVSVKGVMEVPCALNEVLIHSAQMPKMLEFELYIDDAFVYQQSSDGLIISSPTGSTAYSLSAGGPIMHPSLDAIVLVPMFPHTLNSRPLVVPGDSEIRILVSSHVGTNAKISFDSQLEFEIECGDSLIVRKKRERLTLVHPPGHSFYGVCRSKLDWASRVGDS